MSTRTNRTRMIAAASIAVATLTLTACNDGTGTKDEGAANSSTSTSSPSATDTSAAKNSGGTSTGTGTGAGKTDSAGTAAKDSTGGTAGSNGKPGASGSSGTTGSKTSSGGSNDSGARLNPCSPSATRTTATAVTRPLNHLLLTVTNTGSKNCDLVYYPAVQFQDAQSVPPVIEDSQPQAVVTLAPGESGYASVLLSAADGSGSNGYTAKSLAVYFNTDASSAAHPSLPSKGVYLDDSIKVTYWQADMADALNW
ncbi:DUF4232 domain-containing protein [Streptomyces pseudovenezuelae]|uniref:DUF4232 domain-containing protein n=1 Tax=Streptomyces pseudovenezuelae TaxID=67350 RepID=A0ABT6LF15_9ACTN|nr:DUF4232 domain-containing protein [Streptomyces pseudovenezuelae]MDH6214887.1 hypothetical protein [Streptomyces pseudovenezuelae]